MKRSICAGLVLGAVTLSGCGGEDESLRETIPGQRGDLDCYEKRGDQFSAIGEAERVEECAGMLDAIFTQGKAKKLVGAYQGAKIIVADQGVFVSVNGSVAFPLLTRLEDGRLVPQSQAGEQ